MIYVLYFTSQGAPKTGLTPTIITCNKISDGAAVATTPSAWPTVSEIAGGLYKFTLAFPFNSLSEALGVVVDGGSTLANTERYKVMQLTPNDGSLDATVSTRAPEAAGNVAAIKAKTDNLPASPAAVGSAMTLTSAYDAAKSAASETGGNIAAIKAKTDNLPSDPASNTQVNTRLAATDYTAPANANITAIKAKTDNLPSDPASNTNVNTRLATAGYTAPDNAGITAIRAKTDNLPATPANEANVEAHVAAALAAYDPPTRAEATSDKDAVLAAIAGLNDITVGELLAGDISDSLNFPANCLADLVRKLFWVVCNRMAITDASGAFTAYKTGGVTPAATGTITNNGVTTERSEPTWP